jgi:hypothetical protein
MAFNLEDKVKSLEADELRLFTVAALGNQAAT